MAISISEPMLVKSCVFPSSLCKLAGKERYSERWFIKFQAIKFLIIVLSHPQLA